MTPAASPQKKAAGLTLNHFGIYVKDMDESTKFYTEKMGFREAFRFKDNAGVPIVYLQIDHNTFLEMTWRTRITRPGFRTPASCRKTWKPRFPRCRKKGRRRKTCILAAPKPCISNTLDPNGVRLELLSYPSGIAAAKAMDGWK